MIYVSDDLAHQINYLIQQSIEGNHVLFQLADLREAFSSPLDLTEQTAYEVEHHIERLVSKPDLEEQQNYLKSLDAQTLKLVIRTYFNIIENTLYEKKPYHH